MAHECKSFKISQRSSQTVSDTWAVGYGGTEAYLNPRQYAARHGMTSITHFSARVEIMSLESEQGSTLLPRDLHGSAVSPQCRIDAVHEEQGGGEVSSSAEDHADPCKKV